MVPSFTQSLLEKLNLTHTPLTENPLREKANDDLKILNLPNNLCFSISPVSLKAKFTISIAQKIEKENNSPPHFCFPKVW